MILWILYRDEVTMNNEDLQNEEIDEVNTPSEENEEARTEEEYSDD